MQVAIIQAAYYKEITAAFIKELLPPSTKNIPLNLPLSKPIQRNEAYELPFWRNGPWTYSNLMVLSH